MNANQIAAQLDCIARDCIAVRLRLVNRVITSVYDEALRPLGLKASQMNILVVAAKLGVARPAEAAEAPPAAPAVSADKPKRARAKQAEPVTEEIPAAAAEAAPKPRRTRKQADEATSAEEAKD